MVWSQGRGKGQNRAGQNRAEQGHRAGQQDISGQEKRAEHGRAQQQASQSRTQLFDTALATLDKLGLCHCQAAL